MLQNSENDDEEDDIPMFLRRDFNVNITEEGSNAFTENALCKEIDELWLTRDEEKLEEIKNKFIFQNDQTELLQAINLIQLILNGLHIKFFIETQGYDESLREMIVSCLNGILNSNEIRTMLLNYLFDFPDKSKPNCCRCLKLVVIGTLLLELYCQANYTGPELIPEEVSILFGSNEAKEAASFKCAIDSLECDGDYPFPNCTMPQLLYVSRCLLSIIAEPDECFWQDGVYLDSEGLARKFRTFESRQSPFAQQTQKFEQIEQIPSCEKGNSLLKQNTLLSDICSTCVPSRHWRHARASIIHLRLLQNQSHEHIPTLWKECSTSFSKSIAYFGKRMQVLETVDQAKRFLEKDIHDYAASLVAQSNQRESKGELNLVYKDHMLEGQLWLEWGLCQNFFQYKDKGKLSFLRGQAALGLYTLLTASPGKRTKHQRENIAQLYLVAKSSIVSQGSSSTNLVTAVEVSEIAHNQTLSNQQQSQASPDDGSWQHGEWELGRRLVSSADNGDEAAVREVQLDQMDGGAAVNIILEGGPKFANAVDYGGSLHSLDQAVLLCLCLDVSNSNPDDGLTNEQMQPFIERVLSQANNWMIHSTALLQRSWLEYERRKTADRALLQMQALLDQHTTRLTIMQSTYNSIETAAKSYERLQFIHCLSYPAQYEFKRDLAQKYLRYQVFSSALNLFKELEMWDEVVTCYQLMEKPHRAELVVRERLKQGDLTPYMLTSLADLTSQEEYYEQAWTLSKGRFGRAKRTLARICFDRKDFENCIIHMELALAVQPLLPKSWYLMGIACMYLRHFDKALISFTRCAQLDMEIGEAWANMGAIYVELKEFNKAYVSFVEALKQKRESWKIIENLIICSVEVQRHSECILYMNMLLDQAIKLKTQSQNPIHIDSIRKIIIAAFEKSKDSQLKQDMTIGPEVAMQNKINLITKIETLLTRIVNTVGIDVEMLHTVWDASAVFYQLLNKLDKVKDCRVKQFRAILNTVLWEKNSALVVALLSCSDKLVGSHKYQVIV